MFLFFFFFFFFFYICINLLFILFYENKKIILIHKIKVADIFGRKFMIVLTLSLFVVSSFICGGMFYKLFIFSKKKK